MSLGTFSDPFTCLAHRLRDTGSAAGVQYSLYPIVSGTLLEPMSIYSSSTITSVVGGTCQVMQTEMVAVVDLLCAPI